MNQILFLAILVDALTANQLTRRMVATCRKYGFRGRPISAERLHVSLLVLGRYNRDVAELASSIANKIKFPPFGVRFDRALSFKHSDRCPFVLTTSTETTTKFARRLGAAFGVEISRFTPHLTLLWDRKQIDPHQIVPIDMAVRDFALIRNFQEESRYEIVGRWPLTAA